MGTWRGKERSAVGEGWRWDRAIPVLSGPVPSPSWAGSRKGPQDMSQKIGKDLGKKVSQQTPGGGGLTPAPYPILEETSSWGKSSAPLALWVLHGQNQDKETHLRRKVTGGATGLQNVKRYALLLRRHHQGSLGLLSSYLC